MASAESAPMAAAPPAPARASFAGTLAGILGWGGGTVALGVLVAVMVVNHTERSTVMVAADAAAAQQAAAEKAVLLEQSGRAERQRKEVAEEKRLATAQARALEAQDAELRRLNALLSSTQPPTSTPAPPDPNLKVLEDLKAEKARLTARKAELQKRITDYLASWQPGKTVPFPTEATPGTRPPTTPGGTERPPPKEVPAEPAKSDFNPNNLSITFSTNRKTDKSYDEKREMLEMEVKLTNKDTVRDLNGMRLEVFVFAEMVDDRDRYLMLRRHQRDVDIPKHGSVTVDLGTATMYYDKGGEYRYGSKYDGYMVYLVDRQGNVLKTATNKPLWSKMRDQLAKLREMHKFNKDLDDFGRVEYY